MCPLSQRWLEVEVLYMLEVETPSAERTLHIHNYFWAPPGATGGAGYVQAVLRAISFLQSLYEFIVVDYNF